MASSCRSPCRESVGSFGPAAPKLVGPELVGPGLVGLELAVLSWPHWLPLRPDPPKLAAARGRRASPATRAGRVRELLVAAQRYRRFLAAALLAVAVVLAVGALSPAPPPTVAVVVAARDLPAGSVLSATDVTVAAMAPRVAPDGSSHDSALLIGRQLSGRVRRGEELTDARIDDGPLALPGAGLVSAPVRLADAQAARLLQPGQRIDVLAADTSTTPGLDAAGATTATVVAANVQVVAVPRAASPSGLGGGGGSGDANESIGVDGALVVLATSAAQARALAQAEVSARLSAVVVG
jgi:Flp pilus assembly protein CpaB